MDRKDLQRLLEEVQREASRAGGPLTPFDLVSFGTSDRCTLRLALSGAVVDLWIARATVSGGAFRRGNRLALGYPPQDLLPAHLSFLERFWAGLARIEDRLDEEFLALLGRPGDFLEPESSLQASPMISGEDPSPGKGPLHLGAFRRRFLSCRRPCPVRPRRYRWPGLAPMPFMEASCSRNSGTAFPAGRGRSPATCPRPISPPRCFQRPWFVVTRSDVPSFWP